MCVCVCVLPGRCVGVAGVPGAALTRRPAPIMQRGLRAVVRRTASSWGAKGRAMSREKRVCVCQIFVQRTKQELKFLEIKIIL